MHLAGHQKMEVIMHRNTKIDYLQQRKEKMAPIDDSYMKCPQALFYGEPGAALKNPAEEVSAYIASRALRLGSEREGANHENH